MYEKDMSKINKGMKMSKIYGRRRKKKFKEGKKPLYTPRGLSVTH